MWILLLVLLLLGAQLNLNALVPLQAGAIALQVIWFSGRAILPLFVDIALLWAVFGQHVTVSSRRAQRSYPG